MCAENIVAGQSQPAGRVHGLIASGISHEEEHRSAGSEMDGDGGAGLKELYLAADAGELLFDHPAELLSKRLLGMADVALAAVT